MRKVTKKKKRKERRIRDQIFWGRGLGLVLSLVWMSWGDVGYSNVQRTCLLFCLLRNLQLSAAQVVLQLQQPSAASARAGDVFHAARFLADVTGIRVYEYWRYVNECGASSTSSRN